ncbi:unnamed protein product, partial [Mesorhabditis spiculigera]
MASELTQQPDRREDYDVPGPSSSIQQTRRPIVWRLDETPDVILLHILKYLPPVEIERCRVLCHWLEEFIDEWRSILPPVPLHRLELSPGKMRIWQTESSGAYRGVLWQATSTEAYERRLRHLRRRIRVDCLTLRDLDWISFARHPIACQRLFLYIASSTLTFTQLLNLLESQPNCRQLDLVVEGTLAPPPWAFPGRLGHHLLGRLENLRLVGPGALALVPLDNSILRRRQYTQLYAVDDGEPRVTSQGLIAVVDEWRHRGRRVEYIALRVAGDEAQRHQFHLHFPDAAVVNVRPEGAVDGHLERISALNRTSDTSLLAIISNRVDPDRYE